MINYTITLTREEAQQVLDELVLLDTANTSVLCNVCKSIETLRTRLAQPEPELIIPADEEQLKRIAKLIEPDPVAWSYDNKFNWDSWGDGTWQISISQHQERADQIPLYTAPPMKEWVGLTDDEIDSIAVGDDHEILTFARAIEAKLKEKNDLG